MSELVFLQPNGGLITLNRDNGEWKAVLERFGLPRWRGHLNRHITATWLAEQHPSVPEGTVRSILGHESEAMGFYYARSTELQQSEPLRRYGETLFDDPRGEPQQRDPSGLPTAPRTRRGRK